MKVKGGRLMLFVSGTSISYATSHSLNINLELTETSNKDENNPVSGVSWQTQEANVASWDASTENMYSYDGEGNNFDDLFDKLSEGAKVTGIFDMASGTTEDVPTGGWVPEKGHSYYKGDMICTSLQLNAPNGEYATYSASFTGVGALKKITPA